MLEPVCDFSEAEVELLREPSLLVGQAMSGEAALAQAVYVRVLTAKPDSQPVKCHPALLLFDLARDSTC